MASSPSSYLDADDYATYGVPNATSAQVIQASAIIDGYLDRKDGLIYTVDDDNNPTAMLTTGLPIKETKEVPLKNKLVLSYSPVISILSVQYNSNPGGLPRWLSFDSTQYVFTSDGELWLGLPVTPYTEVIVQYVAGWLYADLPTAIKQACAYCITMFQNDFFSGVIGTLQAGDTRISGGNGGMGILDTNTMAMLAPYKRVFA
jgi:hypothetical protein